MHVRIPVQMHSSRPHRRADVCTTKAYKLTSAKKHLLFVGGIALPTPSTGLHTAGAVRVQHASNGIVSSTVAFEVMPVCIYESLVQIQVG